MNSVPLFNCMCMHMQWLKEEFLLYLLEWEESVGKRKGYSKKEKAMMVLSNET